MKLATNMLVLYTVTTVAANALSIRRNVFSRRIFTSIGVSGAHRAFTTKTKKESNQKDEMKETDTVSKTF